MDDKPDYVPAFMKGGALPTPIGVDRARGKRIVVDVGCKELGKCNDPELKATLMKVHFAKHEGRHDPTCPFYVHPAADAD